MATILPFPSPLDWEAAGTLLTNLQAIEHTDPYGAWCLRQLIAVLAQWAADEGHGDAERLPPTALQARLMARGVTQERAADLVRDFFHRLDELDGLVEHWPDHRCELAASEAHRRRQSREDDRDVHCDLARQILLGLGTGSA